MVHRKSFVLLISLVVGITVSARAQEIKSGICPANVNNRYYDFDGGDNFAAADGFNNPFMERTRFAAPQYFPVMINATSFGAGAVGTFPLSDNYILRTSVVDLSSASPFGLAAQGSAGILMPIEFGFRIPLIHSMLGKMDYSLYGETTAGLLLGMAYPTGGSFLDYSIPNSRFSSGASAYIGLGNTLRFDRYVGLYLNGGAGYFDLFSSTFMARPNYLYPSVSIGFYFNLAP
ncbi:MAG TPA: hypothetical protein VLX91_03265 [Candidatus Acidoferrales bacterium]|nr:hypothetical protein [Candidatus Acidoferrales bacterium]